MIKFEGYIDGVDEHLQDLINALLDAVEIRGGTLWSTWGMCDDDGAPVPTNEATPTAGYVKQNGHAADCCLNHGGYACTCEKENPQ